MMMMMDGWFRRIGVELEKRGRNVKGEVVV
jgi:hypothetical protein